MTPYHPLTPADRHARALAYAAKYRAAHHTGRTRAEWSALCRQMRAKGWKYWAVGTCWVPAGKGGQR